jgi:hypothetical protein
LPQLPNEEEPNPDAVKRREKSFIDLFEEISGRTSRMDPYVRSNRNNNNDATAGASSPPSSTPPRAMYGRSSASETWASKSQRLHRPVPSPAHHMTDEQIEAMLSNFATQDALTGNKTWTRIVVEKFLSKVRAKQPRC